MEGCQIRMPFLPSRIVLMRRFSFGTFKVKGAEIKISAPSFVK